VATRAHPKKYPRLIGRQLGLTLIEMMVAMTISLLVALAAVSALIAARQGFTAVDASSQLRDNARFASDLIQRLGVQAGYQNDLFASRRATDSEANAPTGVRGFDHALLSNEDPLNKSTPRSDAMGSDILIIRYQTAETYPGSGVADGSIIDCSGQAPSSVAASKNDSIYSILHVAEANGEPSLMCSYLNAKTKAITTVPIIQGVENFQVLYGVDNVVANKAPSGNTDSVPDQYLRADQLTVSGSSTATAGNWRRVRSLRIGMVLRGAAHSNSQQTSDSSLYPLGQIDEKTYFTVPNDDKDRFRMTSTFTVHLRNDQTLD